MGLKHTIILAAVGILVAQQTSFAAKLCPGRVETTSCQPNCCERHSPHDSPAKNTPKAPSEHRPCCDELFPNTAASLIVEKGASGLRGKAGTLSELLATSGYVLEAGAGSIALRRSSPVGFFHLNDPVLRLSLHLRC